MSYDRNKVIQIAAAEVGYLEKSAAAYRANPAILDEKTAGAGYDNYTKYGRDMAAIYPQTMNFADYWCDTFVDWCFYKAYGVATAKSLLGGGFDDYTIASAKMYQKHNALDTTPEVGSQVFFTETKTVDGCYHTGLVIAVNGSTITTIEGNTSATGTGIVNNGGCVAKKTRTLSGYMLFGHPAYNDGATQTTTGATTTTAGSRPTYAIGKTYTTVVDHLRVRKGPGTNYVQILYSGLSANARAHAYTTDSTLKQGTRVTCKAVKTVGAEVWMQIPSGWICAYQNKPFVS